MGKKTEAESRGSQLVRFLELIKEFFCKASAEEGELVDSYQINQLINELNRAEDGEKLTVNCENISFKVRASNMDPSPKLKGKTIEVTLSLKYDWMKNGSVREVKSAEEKKDDNISIYDCNIQIKGYEEVKNVRRKFAWHLDCEENTQGKYIHPHFHFHAGGKKLSGLNTGELLLISSPRIAYPPMDLPLAINFIIHNFVHQEDMGAQYDILNQKYYKWMLGQSVKNVLRPYFNDLSDNLETTQNHYFPVML